MRVFFLKKAFFVTFMKHVQGDTMNGRKDFTENC